MQNFIGICRVVQEISFFQSDFTDLRF